MPTEADKIHKRSKRDRQEPRNSRHQQRPQNLKIAAGNNGLSIIIKYPALSQHAVIRDNQNLSSQCGTSRRFPAVLHLRTDKSTGCHDTSFAQFLGERMQSPQEGFLEWQESPDPKAVINASLPSTSGSPTTTPKIKLVDVREPAELSGTGIIPSAVNIPLASQADALFLTPDEFETRFGFEKPVAGEGETIVFYCKAGVRAKTAAQMAVQAGYDPKAVGVYLGSWLDWAGNGGRVERWEGDD
ncbi:hypothetical protein PENANT_c013G00706 [Penicillium antarcticum]|uniref:Rhodanese domain-containing protein n=1 Tax=Penicillium antarcticum TaxID=416450 RepID=A0A1V6Q523_9EURO|nr:hypothetical protein PENANT_c013G00706 [Penicillium antarcticum]